MVKYISPVNILFVSKTSSRHLQDMSSRHLQDMSSRRLQDMSSRRLQDVFSVTIFCLPRRLQDVFAKRFQEVFKTSWKTKNCYAEDVLKTSWRPTNVCWEVAYSTWFRSGWQKGKNKFSTNFFYQIKQLFYIPHPWYLSYLHFSVSICKVLSTKTTFQL